jgi:ABC-type transport system substrate-binding protein
VEGTDSDPFTAGRFIVASAADGDIALKPNMRHPRRPSIDLFQIVHVTDPEELRSGFAQGRFDIIVVAGDEGEIFDGTDPRIRNGEIYQSPSNSISVLSARPGGLLADDSLRHAIAAAVPREEFADKYLSAAGRPAYAFTRDSRGRPGRVQCQESSMSSHQRDVTFIVPPSERTVSRARWISQIVHRRAGINLIVTVPSWPAYWDAVSDPQGGDLLWLGISVEFDTPRQWVQDCLFGPWLPVPGNYVGLKERVRATAATDEELIAAEATLLADGWLMPLYHHYQTYLVRKGLQGLQLDPTDWPIPGIHHAEDLRWG